MKDSKTAINAKMEGSDLIKKINEMKALYISAAAFLHAFAPVSCHRHKMKTDGV